MQILQKWALTILVLLGLVGEASAQMVISVDTAISRNSGKSLAAAMALSAMVPGLGQNYLGERQRVKAFVWTDALGWSTVAIAWFAGDAYLRSAQSYARRYAGANPPKDAVFLDVMSRYRSRSGVAGQNSNPDLTENYDMSMIRAGLAVDAVYSSDPAHTWDWGSSDNPATTAHMQSFSNIVRNYRFSKIAFQVALGVVVVNRLVSVLDVMRIHRATSTDPLTLQLVPIWSPESAGADLQVAF